MSLLNRLARSLRPTSFNPTANLRARTQPANRMSSEFFSPHSLHRVGFGQRFYSSFGRDYTSINTQLLYGVMGVNVAIFGYAQYIKMQAAQGFPQPLIAFMQNMTLNLDDVKAGRYWTLITSCFTHLTPMHLLGNMLSIYYMGGMLAGTPGFAPMRFLTLILGSGLCGSLGYIYLRQQVVSKNKDRRGRHQQDYSRGLGFSGAVMGVGAVAAFLYPRAQMLIYGIVPMPLWALMLGYGIYDGYYLHDEGSRVGHAGHLGGGVFGVLYFLMKMRGHRGF